jgi:hypothetical protein
MFHGIFDLFAMGELDAVVRQDDTDAIRQRLLEMAQKLRGLRLSGPFMQFGISKLADSVNGDEQIKPALGGMHFGDVDVMAFSSPDRMLECGCFGPVGRSLTDCRFFHLVTVLGLMPYGDASWLRLA